MNEIMAYCGLLCNECPAYKATVADDMALRKKTAEEWSEMFKTTFKPEDINCLGCTSEVLSGYCKTCGIRACAREKALGDCGRCSSFPCTKVEGIINHNDAARKRLSRE